MKNLPVVAIIGRPNVGKSSLFNRLVGRRVAIISEIAGTTRDRVEAVVEWNGKKFRLIDTAGLDKPSGDLEHSMQEQVQLAIISADLIVVVVDGSSLLQDGDLRAIAAIQKAGQPLIVAINKSDRKGQPLEKTKLRGAAFISVSATLGHGDDELLVAITKQIPKRNPKQPEVTTIAVLGRPNVGKSTLLNQLAGEPRAIVSDQAGTTRDVNRLELTYQKQPYELLDTAGLRRPGKSGRGMEKFSLLRTQAAIETSDICILLTDAAEAATTGDQRIAGLIKDAGKGLIMAVNKWDLTEGDDATRHRLEANYRQEFPFAWWAPLVFISAREGYNINRLLPLVTEIQKRRRYQFQTAELNRLLETTVAEHPPAGLRNRHPKLRYITQTGTSPPEFTIFGSGLDFLHWSYKRHLEKRLREQYDFIGTPVQLVFRDKPQQMAKRKKQ